MITRKNAEKAIDEFIDQCLEDLGPVTLEEIFQERAQLMRELQEPDVTVDDLRDWKDS